MICSYRIQPSGTISHGRLDICCGWMCGRVSEWDRISHLGVIWFQAARGGVGCRAASAAGPGRALMTWLRLSTGPDTVDALLLRPSHVMKSDDSLLPLFIPAPATRWVSADDANSALRRFVIMPLVNHWISCFKFSAPTAVSTSLCFIDMTKRVKF